MLLVQANNFHCKNKDDEFLFFFPFLLAFPMSWRGKLKSFYQLTRQKEIPKIPSIARVPLGGRIRLLQPLGPF